MLDPRELTAPFRMQPGLRRVTAQDCRLTPLVSGSGLHAEKQRVIQAGEAVVSIPGFDPEFAIKTIATYADLARAGGEFDLATRLALAVQEDWAILDGITGTVPWMCVCVPSHWAPEDKVGRTLAAIHAPVADGTALQAAQAHLVRLVTSGEHWERHVWTLTPSPRFDQHPRRWPRTPWPATPDAQAFAQSCHWRTERQTFIPVPGTSQAVFAIRVEVAPLTCVISSPDQARALHASLASMTEAVLSYKNLLEARAPLLRWLDSVK